jgi:peptidoglycan/LPS O-acetylase OafA/YrhL
LVDSIGAPGIERPAYNTRHLAALDGLRGIAILLVVWYHLWLVSWLSADVTVLGKTFNFNVFPETGMTGVYLFFFISGFCLFYPYAQTMFDGRPPQSVAMFAYRRILKIAPSYYVGIALWIAFGFASFSSFGDGVRQVVTHVLFIQTFWDDTYSGINGVLWSLAVEVQFYAIFPLLCWAFVRRPIVAFLATAVVANAYRLVVVHHPNVSHEIEQLPGAIDVFASGMFAAWAYRAIAARLPALANRKDVWTCVAVLGIGAIVAALENIYAHRNDTAWILTWNTYGVPTIALAFIPATVGSLFAFNAWQRILGNPALLGLSFVSYNLYLWHQVLAQWLESRHIAGFHGTDPSIDSSVRLLYFGTACALGIGVAWVITVCVEQPLLRRRPFQSFVSRLGGLSKEPHIPSAQTASANVFGNFSGKLMPLFAGGAIAEPVSRAGSGSAPLGAPSATPDPVPNPPPKAPIPKWEPIVVPPVLLAIVGRAGRFFRLHAELIVVVGIAYVVALLSSHFRATDFNNYTRLADAMRHGHMWIDYPGRWLDAIEYKGQHYVVDGPFPALLMFPLVFVYGAQANQTSVALIVAAACIGLAHTLLMKMHVARLPRLMLLLFLFAGTDLWWCAELGDVWFMAHLCAMMAVFAAFLELIGKRRGWVLGLLAIAAFFSRNVEVFAIGFFAYAMYTGDLARAAVMDRGEPEPKPIETRRAFLSLGTVLSFGVLLWIGYNEASWGTLVDIGHSVYFHQDSWGQKDGSPFRLTYLPYQIYSYFMRAPVFVEWLQQAQWPILKVDTSGVALTFTSPALIMTLLAKRPARLVAALWLTTAAVAGPDFLYYLNGWYQFGMRHALDFEPYLFVLMALAVRDRMPRWGIVLCVYSAIAGAWGVWWWNTFMRTGG